MGFYYGQGSLGTIHGKAAPRARVTYSVHTLPAKLTVGCLFVAEFQTFLFKQRFSCHCNSNSQPLHCFSAQISTLGTGDQAVCSISCTQSSQGLEVLLAAQENESSCKMRIWCRLAGESLFSNRSMTLKLSGIANPAVNMGYVDSWS